MMEIARNPARDPPKGQHLNTRIGYHYADNRDCRQFTSIVISGTITWEQIRPFLTTQGSFIPGQLGLEDLQHRFKLPGLDHSWHQMTPSDIRPTEDTPTITLTGEELARRFAEALWNADWFVNDVLHRPIVSNPAATAVANTPIYARENVPTPQTTPSRARKAATRVA